MKFKDGDEVIVKNNNDVYFKRLSSKKGIILMYSDIYKKYIVIINKNSFWIPKNLITTELQYFMEEMTK